MATNDAKEFLSREDFLAPDERRIKDVYLPVRRKWVKIRSLFEHEKEAYEASLRDKNGDVTNESAKASRRRLIALCLCDAKGNRVLSDADVDAMRDKDGTDLAYLQEECQVFCGFKKGEIDAIEKNSEPVPADS